MDSVYQAVCTRSAAIKYLEPELAKKCADYVERNMTVDDVCPVLDYVLGMGDNTIELHAWAHLCADSLSVLSKGFECCSAHTVHYVLDNVINVPEISVIRALHTWATNQCVKALKDDGKEKSIRQVMQPFFSKLRFLALTATEFVSGPNLWGALNDQEARALLSNIIKKRFTALAEWLLFTQLFT